MFGGIFKTLINRDYDEIITEKISSINEDYLIAQHQNSFLYATFVDLNGFLFINFIVKSNLKIKTLKGCVVTFTGKNENLILEADNEEIETDYSNALQSGVTNIDVDYDSPLTEFIKNEDSFVVSFAFEKDQIQFEITDSKLMMATLTKNNVLEEE